MQWTEIPTGQTHRAFSTFMTSLGDRADAVVTRLNTEEAFAGRLATICHNNGFEPSSSQQRAREIMGKNMFGTEEAIKHFGINPSKRQLAYMAEVPYSEATLIACKDTHVAVAVFRFSGMEVREKVKSKKVFCKQDWYDEQAFANEKGAFEWHLVRKTHVKDSTSKTWDEQQGLLSPDEETPTFQVLTYTVIGHFLATGEKLFENVYVRTSSFGSDGYRVLAGWSSGGFSVAGDSGGYRSGSLAVSSSRKQES